MIDYVLIVQTGQQALVEEKIVPDIIATDLDGKINDILYANAHGASLVIHGHGNNMDAV